MKKPNSPKKYWDSTYLRSQIGWVFEPGYADMPLQKGGHSDGPAQPRLLPVVVSAPVRVDRLDRLGESPPVVVAENDRLQLCARQRLLLSGRLARMSRADDGRGHRQSGAVGRTTCAVGDR